MVLQAIGTQDKAADKLLFDKGLRGHAECTGHNARPDFASLPCLGCGRNTVADGCEVSIACPWAEPSLFHTSSLGWFRSSCAGSHPRACV